MYKNSGIINISNKIIGIYSLVLKYNINIAKIIDINLL